MSDQYSRFPKSISNPCMTVIRSYLLAVLFKHPQLQTLVQLCLLDLPELQELLLAGVYLVKQLHDGGYARLQVGVEGHVAGGAVPATVAAVVAVPALTGWKPENYNVQTASLSGSLSIFYLKVKTPNKEYWRQISDGSSRRAKIVPRISKSNDISAIAAALTFEVVSAPYCRYSPPEFCGFSFWLQSECPTPSWPRKHHQRSHCGWDPPACPPVGPAGHWTARDNPPRPEVWKSVIVCKGFHRKKHYVGEKCVGVCPAWWSIFTVWLM